MPTTAWSTGMNHGSCRAERKCQWPNAEEIAFRGGSDFVQRDRGYQERLAVGGEELDLAAGRRLSRCRMTLEERPDVTGPQSFCGKVTEKNDPFEK